MSLISAKRSSVEEWIILVNSNSLASKWPRGFSVKSSVIISKLVIGVRKSCDILEKNWDLSFKLFSNSRLKFLSFSRSSSSSLVRRFATANSRSPSRWRLVLFTATPIITLLYVKNSNSEVVYRRFTANSMMAWTWLLKMIGRTATDHGCPSSKSEGTR